MKKIIMDVLQNGTLRQVDELKKICNKNEIEFIDKMVHQYEMMVLKDSDDRLNQHIYKDL